VKVEFTLTVYDAVRLRDALEDALGDCSLPHGRSLFKFVQTMVDKSLATVDTAACTERNACKDCGAPGMGDAYYDNYPGEDPRRCTACGML
jgi:hypothetical protein